MTEVTRFQLGFQVPEDELSPGDLFRMADGTVWKVNPDGSFSQLGSGGALPEGWTQSGDPAEVDAHGGRLTDLAEIGTPPTELEGEGQWYVETDGANLISEQFEDTANRARWYVRDEGLTSSVLFYTAHDLANPDFEGILYALQDDDGNPAGKLAIFDGMGVGQQTVNGALSAITDAAAKAVLTSLLNALAAYGLIKKSTT